MASGQQKAKENLDKFLSWKATKSDADYKDMVFRGGLSRTEIAKQTGIGKSALNQNPALKDALLELEDYLRNVGILPIKTDDNIVKPAQKTAPIRDKNARKVKTLEAENNKLRNEVLELKAKLERFSELEEVLNEMGLI